MQIKITAANLVRGKVNERTSFTATATFYSDAFVAAAPTNAQYRLDWVTSNADCYSQITDWTTLTPASSISIPITATQNAIQGCLNQERRQITVRADNGLATQAEETFQYTVQNLAGST